MDKIEVKKEEPKEIQPKKSPIEFFFSLGDKVTKGDIVKKAQFDYSLLWVIFFAFITVAIGNVSNFMKTGGIQYIGWAVVMLGILWFQYFGLKQAYHGLQAIKSMRKATGDPKALPEEKVEDVDEMLKGFKEK